MALESVDDITFSLKVFASAFEVATELVGADQNDTELREDVISICENNIRHGHQLFRAEENSQNVF